MKGKCGDCPAFSAGKCIAMGCEVEAWWTGCRIDAENWVRQQLGLVA